MKYLSRPSLLLWGLCLLFCITLVTDWIPWWRGAVPWLPADARWVWPYDLPRWAWLLPCALGLAIYVIGALRLLSKDEGTRYPIRLILWSFGGAVLLTLLLLTLEERPLYLLFTRSASTVTGAYQYASNLIGSLGETLRHWPAFVNQFRAETRIYGGVALDPPGLTALYYTASRVLQAFPSAANALGSLVRPLECQNLYMMAWNDPQIASAWLQIFMPAWAALAVAPLYRLGEMVFGRQTALWAVALWPLVPGVAMFTPRFNAFYPLITLVMLCVLWRGLEHNRWPLVALAGFVLSGGTFLNLSLVPLGLLAGLTILIYGFWKPARLVRGGLALAVGAASVWLVYWLLSGISPIEIVNLGLSAHFELNRPYLPWLVLHPYDMLLFVGLPIAALSVWRLIRARRPASRADTFTLAAGLNLLLLVLSGTARGETGRVWLFLAPLWILLGAEMLQCLRSRERGGLLVMQALCLLSMAAVLRVHFTALTVPPAPSPAAQSASVPVNVQFSRQNDRVTLVGFSAETNASTITLHLHWRAETQISRPYVLSMVSVPPDRSRRNSLNWNPLDWNYPPSCWLPSQEFVDTVNVPLGANPPPGDWWFSVAISDVFTQEPMRVNGDTQVGIGPVRVGDVGR